MTIFYRLNVCAPNLYVEILTTNVMVLGGGTLGRWIGHESEALMNGIRALIKETKKALSPHYREDTD